MRILLAIDDSKFSQAAVRTLLQQFQPRQAAVMVLHVVEPLESAYYPELTPPYPMDFRDIENKRKEAGRKLIARAVEKLRTAGFKADGSLRGGHVRTAIVDAAAKGNAKLIVLGSHGRKGLSKLLLGSVSEYVVRHAPCSVQIVRTKPSGVREGKKR